MSFFKAILMGLTQGITEFLPISSSGHLTIMGSLLHINTDTGVLFEVMLHMGTLLAVFFAFRTDIQRMFWEMFRILADIYENIKIFFYNKIHETDEQRYKKILHNNYRKLLVMIVVSTVPTGIIGYLFRDLAAIASQSLLAAGLGLLVTAVLLLVVDYWNCGTKIPKDITVGQALLLGICQGIGVFPGVSRSGITITAGLLCGFKRNFAVRYSFLMSVPAVIGAMILEMREFTAPAMNFQMIIFYIAGMLVAAVSGYFCIRAMLALIQRKRFRVFAFYCLIVGIIAIAGNFAVIG